MIEERIRDDFDFVEEDVRVTGVHADGRRITDEMNVVTARGKFLAQLRGDYAGAAIRWIACNADAHETASHPLRNNEANRLQRLPHVTQASCRPVPRRQLRYLTSQPVLRAPSGLASKQCGC